MVKLAGCQICVKQLTVRLTALYSNKSVLYCVLTADSKFCCNIVPFSFCSGFFTPKVKTVFRARDPVNDLFLYNYREDSAACTVLQ